MGIVQGSSKTHTTLNGTAGDDLFIVPAAFTTINGEGGNDLVSAQSGFETFNQGTIGDQISGYTDSLTLAGQLNTVTGGDGNFTITDLTGGLNTISLGDGADTVLLAGSYNNVTLGIGQSNISFLSGNNTVTYDLSVDKGGSANVTLSGTHNTLSSHFFGSPGHSGDENPFVSAIVTGGTGNSAISFTSLAAEVRTDGLYNVVSLGGGSGDITPGSGHDTVNLSGYPGESDFGSRFIGDYAVHLKGIDNVVNANVAQLTIDGGDGSGQFIFEVPNDNYDSYHPFTPPLVYNVTTGGMNNTFSLSDVDSNTIIAGSGDDHVTILTIIVGPQNPADPDPPLPTYPGSFITFAGLDNTLSDTGQADNTITGGTGQGSFVLGRGNSTLTTGGSLNKVTAGAGTDTITPGSDHATVTLNGTNAHLLLQGDDNAVFLNSGASGSITGVAPDLHVTVATGIGAEIINGLAADLHAVFTLTGGAGGYTSTAQIKAALQSDGSGGTLLMVGAGSLDFTGVAPASIAASSFIIEP